MVDSRWRVDRGPSAVSPSHELAEEEPTELDHEIVERVRLLEQMRAHGAMMRFSIGQRVSFDDSDGRSVGGVYYADDARRSATTLSSAPSSASVICSIST